MKIYRAMILLLLTGSCASYSPVTDVEPRVELPESFSEQGIEAEDRWWLQLEDTALGELVDTVLADSLTLRMAWSRLDQMRAVARMAGAGRYPSADLLVSGERQRLGGELPPTQPQSTVDTMLASVSVSYQVDLWQKIANSRRAELLALQASRQDLEATALAVTAAAAELWYSIAAEQATIALLEEQLAVGEAYLDLVQVRFANGLASAMDVYQQRLQVATTHGQIPVSETRLGRLRHQLALLQGRQPQARIALPNGRLPVLPELPATGVPATRLRRRPDVRASELRLIAADHRLAVAIADRLPSLSISAASGGQAASFSQVLDQWFVNLAASIFAPILDGGRRQAEVERKRAVVEERFYAWEADLLNACLEVEDALLQEQGLRERSEILANQVVLAEAALERSRALYVNGLTDYLNVLTSLQSLQSLQRAAISIRLELLNNRIRLYLALGGSWPASLQPPEEA
jgi:NodT family efflux transporter outer membrane factor (OMF) lipoprotein